MPASPSDLGRPIQQTTWPAPQHVPLSGAYCQLDPLGAQHVADLWPQTRAHPASFDYLRYGPFDSQAALSDLISDLSSRPDQPFWAVRPQQGPAMGWASICDIYQSDGSIEIGSIWFSPTLQGTRTAREALFLLMRHCMDDLGYERLVWRCQAQNAKSHRAAENLGFTYEGTWRNAAVVKGWQRDVAWFSILRSEWPSRKAALTQWLRPDNFDAAGTQIHSLRNLRA